MASGNQDLLFHLGLNEALPAASRPDRYVALQRRHPDGAHWVELARFLTMADAQAAWPGSSRTDTLGPVSCASGA